MAHKDVIVEEEEEDLGMAMQKLPIPFKELEQIPLYGLANRVKDIIDSSSILLEDSDPSHVSSDISPPRNKRGRRKNSEAKEEVDDLTDKSCSHCGTRHTPLWREGPRGAGTLCNACGMRYRTGRLLPEYRPASSPGFKPDVHSNFHRKVLEIRRERNPSPPPR